MIMIIFFFFKQKTAYEIPLCDWSSDVCSSDLDHVVQVSQNRLERLALVRRPLGEPAADLARGDTRQYRVTLDFLEVTGDPVDRLATSVAELVRGHEPLKCLGTGPRRSRPGSRVASTAADRLSVSQAQQALPQQARDCGVDAAFSLTTPFLRRAKSRSPCHLPITPSPRSVARDLRRRCRGPEVEDAQSETNRAGPECYARWCGNRSVACRRRRCPLRGPPAGVHCGSSSPGPGSLRRLLRAVPRRSARGQRGTGAGRPGVPPPVAAPRPQCGGLVLRAGNVHAEAVDGLAPA